MKRKLFTKEEVMLCTYIARFGRAQFDEANIHFLENRSLPSIKMKVANIASMLAEEGFETHQDISKLTGKKQGEKGRKTNWDIVSNLVDYNQQELYKICQKTAKL